MDELERRKGLPDALRFLLEDYPRPLWESHRNFDGLTRFWLDRHLMFRDLLGRLQDGNAEFLDRHGPADRHAARTARYAGFFLNELHGHHQIEDQHYFPVLAGLEPRLGRGFELLDADHHALDGHLHALAEGTRAMLEAIARAPAAEMRTASGRLQTQLEGFGRFLDRHLTDEEDLVVPVILRHAPRF